MKTDLGSLLAARGFMNSKTVYFDLGSLSITERSENQAHD